MAVKRGVLWSVSYDNVGGYESKGVLLITSLLVRFPRNEVTHHYISTVRLKD